MPYCPECKFEYRSDISKCSDCDTWLVDSLDQSNSESGRGQASAQRPTSPPPEYSEELKKILKSMPKGPTIPTGPVSPRSRPATDEYEIDSDDEMAKKLDQYPTWIEIAHFPSEQLSRIVSDGLESLGVPCVVMPGTRSGTVFGEMYGGVMKAHGNDILLVPEEFVEKADIEAAELLGEAYEQFKTPKG